MEKHVDANRKLQKIQSLAGDGAGRVLGNAWKGLAQNEREHYDTRVFQLKLDILNSDEGKEALRQMCIDELAELQLVTHF